MKISAFCLWEGQQPEFLFSDIRQVHAGGAELPDHPEVLLCPCDHREA